MVQLELMILLSASGLFTLISKEKVLVKGHDSTITTPLTCLINNSFSVSWEKNSTYQVTFTAWDNDSLDYSLLDIQGTITFEGQQYIIKQISPDYSGATNTVQVTATHIYNTVAQLYQHDTKTGELTYSPASLLGFFFDNNNMGFTYSVYGNFENEQITDLGNCSGLDALSKITDTWPDAIIFPDNKHIRVYTSDAFEQNLGNRIDYLNNTSEIEMDYDSTDMTNTVKVYGKRLDTDSDSDSDVTHYYFEPFTVSDEDSIKKWGTFPQDDLSDERFTNADSMRQYAMSQFISEPSLSITITMDSNEKPVAGETRRVEIRDKGFVTNVSVVQYQWYPFSSDTQTTLTLNSEAKTILDYQSNNKQQLTEVLKNQQNILNKYNNLTINNGSGQKVSTWSNDNLEEFTSNLSKYGIAN